MKSGVLHRVFLVTVVAILLVTAAAKTVALLQGAILLRKQPTQAFSPPRPLHTPLDQRRHDVGGGGVRAGGHPRPGAVADRRGATGAGRLRGGRVRRLSHRPGVVGYRHPCGCLGGPLDWLHLSRHAYDALTLGIIVYLLAGSYGLLGWDAIASRRRVLAPAGRALRPPVPAN